MLGAASAGLNAAKNFFTSGGGQAAQQEAQAAPQQAQAASNAQNVLTTGEQAIANLSNELQFTKTTLERMENPGRAVPVQTLADTILNGTKAADPQGAEGAAQFTSEIVKNGKPYNLTVIYQEATKTILHFHYEPIKAAATK